ncbi:AAA family ATPase, partial [Thermogutta sp.]|uniref:AAA family ATPase n=1 Tax=Thermogutta sp. TaxID=1962930 RepID=UPI00321F936A
DVGRVHVLRGLTYRDADGSRRERCLTLADLPVMEKALQALGDCRLLVIDPIGDFLGGQVDAHRDNEVRAVLTPLGELAGRYKVAVIVVVHRRKSAGGGGADEMAMGSRGFTGIARSVWHVSRDVNDKKRRLFLPGKQNLAEEMPGLAFRIVGEPPRVEWEREPVLMTADDGLEAERQAAQPGPKPDSLEDAKAFLLTALSNGPRLANDVLEDWQTNYGGSQRTLYRAKAEIAVESFREGNPGPWFWKLPEGHMAKTRAHCQAHGQTQITWQSVQCVDKNGVSEVPEGAHCQDCQVIGELGNLAKTRAHCQAHGQTQITW